MSEFNTVIIGSGLGGLIAGATLAKSGKKVLVLEQHYIPGGCATTFKRKDFIMEAGLHEMDGLFEKDEKVTIFDSLDVMNNVEFQKVPELYHLKSDRFNFTFPHGTSIAEDKLIGRFPKEKKGIKKFIKIINGVLEEVPKMPQERWKTTLIYPLMPLLYPNTVLTSRITIGQWLDKNIFNDELKLILLTNLLYYSDDPYSMCMMYFALAQASYIGGGGHFVKGGSQKLSDYLAKYIENTGGQILLGKKVTEIILHNDMASGVKFVDSFNISIEPTQVTADNVIANAAIPLIPDLLPKIHALKIEKKIKSLIEACSLFSIYIGFDIDLKELGIKHYSTFVLGDNINDPKDIKPNNQGDWNKKGFAFVNYSALDSGLTENGKSFGVICAIDYLKEWESLSEIDYKIKKEEVAAMFFKRLESHFPGIIKHIEHYEVGTAKTIKRYTLNPKGTAYGYAQIPSQCGLERIPIKSPVKDLYFCSAWAFPGGGFTGAIFSGYICATGMIKHAKWKNKDNDLIIDSRIIQLKQNTVIAENTLELIFEKPADFNYKPGQYVVLKLNNPKKTELDVPYRCLSMVSHPDDGDLKFAMRISKSSFKLSCQLMDISETATLYGPMGEFTINDYSSNLAFIVCGIGITPIIPMLKELEKRNYNKKVLLIYSNRTEKSTAFLEYLSKVNLRNFSFISNYSSISGRINKEYLKDKIINFNDYSYFLSGTTQFIQSMKQILIGEKVNKSKIKEDDLG